jgi:hypothetical protein
MLAVLEEDQSLEHFRWMLRHWPIDLKVVIEEQTL